MSSKLIEELGTQLLKGNPVNSTNVNNNYGNNNYGSIQGAYQLEDGSLSRKMHDNKNNIEEYHKVTGSDVLKSVIFGGLDGIITTFSIICACYASHQATRTIIILGFANILSAAISMGHGDYFSEKTEQDFIQDQYKRETWEMDNYPEGEITEMCVIYKNEYNIPDEDTNIILNTMAKYKKLFVDHMMVLELGLLPPDNSVNPMKNGLATFISFIVFGSIPLIVYIFTTSIVWSIICTVVTLGILGFTRSYFTKTSRFWNCLVTILNGCLSASAAYGISYGLDRLITK